MVHPVLTDDQLRFLRNRSPTAYYHIILENPSISLSSSHSIIRKGLRRQGRSSLPPSNLRTIRVRQKPTRSPHRRSTVTPAPPQAPQRDLSSSYASHPLPPSPSLSTSTLSFWAEDQSSTTLPTRAVAARPAVLDHSSFSHPSSSVNMLRNLRERAHFGIHNKFASDCYGGLDCRGLTFVSVTENTRKLYIRAFDKFQSCVNVNLLSLLTLDEAMADYGDKLHEDDPRPGVCQSVKRLASYMLIVQPDIKGHLHRTKRITSAWDSAVPPKSATPVSRDIMLAFIGKFLSENNYDSVLYMALCWGGLLRVSEARDLHRQHLSLPGDLRPHSQRPTDIGIAIARSKTGKDQYAFVSDATLVSIIQRLTIARSSESKLL